METHDNGTAPAIAHATAPDVVAALSLLESKRPTRGLLQLTLDTTSPVDQRYAATYALGFTSAALSDARDTGAIADAFMTVLRTATPAGRGCGRVRQPVWRLFWWR